MLCMFMLFRDRHGWTHSKQLCPSCPKQVTKCWGWVASCPNLKPLKPKPPGRLRLLREVGGTHWCEGAKLMTVDAEVLGLWWIPVALELLHLSWLGSSEEHSCEKDTATLSCRRPFLSQQSTTIITIYHNQHGEIKKFGVENSWGCLSFSNFTSINAQWRHRNNAFTQGQGPPGVSTSFDVVMAALPLEPLLGAWTNWCLWWKYLEIGIIPYLQRSLRINDYTCLYMFILNDSIINGYMNPHQSHYGYITSMYVCIYIMYIYT